MKGYFKRWNWDVFSGITLLGGIGILSDKIITTPSEKLIMLMIVILIALFFAWFTK